MAQEWPRESLGQYQSLLQSPHEPNASEHAHEPNAPQHAHEPNASQHPHEPNASEQRRYSGHAPGNLRRHPPMAIDTALRSYCEIRAKQYFVAALMEDGTATTIFSPGPQGQQVNDGMLRQFFDPQQFVQVVSQFGRAQPPMDSASGFDGNMSFRSAEESQLRPVGRRPISGGDGCDCGDDSSQQLGHKRPRLCHPIHDVEDVPRGSATHRLIKLSDTEALSKFYDHRFRSCQQIACKLLVKAWVKVIEPKKQSIHPYIGGDAKAPDWWPKPWGTTNAQKVRHKEPDHLYKRERVHLLKHILNLVVEPAETQHPDIRRLGLHVQKLEECALDALSGFYAESITARTRKPYLEEIFVVAREQEKYKKGEIVGDPEVSVMNEDYLPYERNKTPEQDGSTYVKAEENALVPRRYLQQPQAPTAPMMHDLGPQGQQTYVDNTPAYGPPAVTGPGGNAGAAYVNNTPVNGPPAVTGPGGNAGAEMVVIHDNGQRTSIFNGYNNLGNHGMYPAQWPVRPAPPALPAIYTGGQGNAQAQGQSFVPPVPTSHSHQHYVPHTYPDGLPRHGYDTYQC